MTDSPEDGFNMYAQLLLESIAKLSGQTEELKKQSAALDKTICLLKQSYESNLLADHQAFHDLIAQVQRITEIVTRITSLEAAIPPSRWANRFIADFFQKTGWIYGALIMGSIGYWVYLVAVKILPH
ncbi:MAG: hypothetical protein C0394_08130 [Syntrophus sp. (in: bacteria)]|nr:hypothetical protein [Syntrophus sp. (in: bacteria)]